MKARRLLLLVLACALCPAAQEDAPWQRMLESRKQVTAYLERSAERLTAQAAQEIRSRESWEKVRARRLEETRDMLGLLPWPKRTPLKAQVTGVLDQGGYRVEKIALQSLPEIYVTANLYIPTPRAGRRPAIVYVCGHSFSPYGAKTAYQQHGISFAKNGYVAFILDPIQIAETFALHRGVKNLGMYDWYSRGYTPAGVEVWNAIRAIDYLETRPEVDKDRIGMTGRSGGAAMTWFTAALDPRIQVAVPVMGISTYAANVRENTQRLHCDCMFPINSHLHDMMHQGALIAPRPLLMAHGKKDSLFPVAGYEEFQERISALYRDYGHPEHFQNIVVDTGHQDSDYLREQAIRWFDRYLMRIPERRLDMQADPVAPETLAVFQGKPPSTAENFRVHGTFTTRAPSPRLTKLGAWETRRKELLARLRFPFPERPAELQIRRQPMVKGDPYQELEFFSEEGISLRALLRKPAKAKERLPGLLYIASDGEDRAAIDQLLSGVNHRNAAIRLIVYPRGVGEVPWPVSFWKDTLRNAMHVGHTVDSMRLWDVLRAVEALRAEEGVDRDRIMVVGKGVSGALGLYAAILDPGIQQVMLIDPPSSHVQGPIFLNILRHTDLPEAAALLAPRRLNFYARVPAAYDYTRHVYALYGKPDHLFLSMNIEGVLEGRYDHNYTPGQ